MRAGHPADAPERLPCSPLHVGADGIGAGTTSDRSQVAPLPPPAEPAAPISRIDGDDLAWAFARPNHPTCCASGVELVEARRFARVHVDAAGEGLAAVAEHLRHGADVVAAVHQLGG